MIRRAVILPIALVAATLLAGCHWRWPGPSAEPTRQGDLTFERGAQMLAGGSPKSAIPYFSELIVTEPDGPEPHAMLALAYALDQQPDRAIAEAGRVRRDYSKGDLPGWEVTALGVAALTQRRAADAVTHMRQAADSHPDLSSAQGAAASQWLTLALLFAGDAKTAADNLNKLIAAENAAPAARQTALLWRVLVRATADQKELAQQALVDLARAAGTNRRLTGETLDVATAEPADVSDAAVAAIAAGNSAPATAWLTTLHQRSANVCDSATWLGLIAAADGQSARSREWLRIAADTGPRDGRALANQLYSVLAAADGRADLMITHMLTGQRLACRNNFPMQTPAEPARDHVWHSDRMK